jgi:hypothetical protein
MRRDRREDHDGVVRFSPRKINRRRTFLSASKSCRFNSGLPEQKTVRAARSRVMNRKDEVSDKLIDISDRLKKSVGSGRPGSGTDQNIPTYAILPQQQQPTAARPEHARVRRSADGEHAKRDLAVRIAKDLSLTGVALEQLESRLSGLREIEVQLKQQGTALEELTQERCGVTFAKEIDDARIAYFRTAARRQALEETETKPESEAGLGALNGVELLKKGAWLMALPSLSILIAAILIAAALIAAFR